MRIAVMGAGALGGYFGGRLANQGHEVTLVARGAHLAALKENGLRILSPKGDFHLPDIPATSDPREIGPVDLILFTVKIQDVESSAEALLPVLGPDTWAITVQNGVSAPDRLAVVIGSERVVPGVVRMPADIAEPGVIRHSASFDIFQFGEVDRTISSRVQRLHKALLDAGCMPEVSSDIITELWRKFTMQASLASFCALTRLNFGPIRENAECASLFRGSIAETAAVGKTIKSDLPDDLADRAWDFVQKIPPDAHASMLDDLNRGKPIEIDYLSGEVVKLGRKHNVPTPIHEVFLSLLSPYRNGFLA